jgi:aspartyl/glutamyl-tRNA(Asn/Gln) amidotransferase C subunit
MRHPIDNLNNVFREDITWKSLSNDEALKNAEYTKDGYFKVPRVLKGKN